MVISKIDPKSGSFLGHIIHHLIRQCGSKTLVLSDLSGVVPSRINTPADHPLGGGGPRSVAASADS